MLEPYQRSSREAGGQRLSVARHIADLHEVVNQAANAGSRPALVGHSWGAMLALAYAAAHPVPALPLVLIGCGTFDPIARARMTALIAERTTPIVARRLAALEADTALDDDARFRRRAELFDDIYCVDPVRPSACPHGDARASRETWDDMLRLQSEGLYPAAFRAITAPTIMLHGADDPHPGPMIRDSLLPFIPQLQFSQWPRCGHYPWLERDAHADFCRTLHEWLLGHAAP